MSASKPLPPGACSVYYARSEARRWAVGVIVQARACSRSKARMSGGGCTSKRRLYGYLDHVRMGDHPDTIRFATAFWASSDSIDAVVITLRWFRVQLQSFKERERRRSSPFDQQWLGLY